MSDIKPPCDCAELIDGKWSSRCYCSNRDDGEYTAAWCVKTNCDAELITLRAEVERLTAGIADMRHTIDQSGKEIGSLCAENDRLRADLHFNQRAAEMSAALLRDKRRTKAYGAVADMVERIACQFDRLAAKARAALAEEKTNG